MVRSRGLRALPHAAQCSAARRARRACAPRRGATGASRPRRDLSAARSPSLGAQGGTSSRDDGESRWGVFLLCGGADNVIVDEKEGTGSAPPPFLQNYARRSQRLDGKSPSKREMRQSKRAAESATSFLKEFKAAMKGRGFTAIKYGRKGKPSARCFYLDDAEVSRAGPGERRSPPPSRSRARSLSLTRPRDVQACIVWNSSKMSSTRRIAGARVDSIALLEITDVLRGADAIPFDVAPETSKCCLSLRCGTRQLALQLDSEQNRELIADGVALLVSEAYAAREASGGGAPPEKI